MKVLLCRDPTRVKGLRSQLGEAHPLFLYCPRMTPNCQETPRSQLLTFPSPVPFLSSRELCHGWAAAPTDPARLRDAARGAVQHGKFCLPWGPQVPGKHIHVHTHSHVHTSHSHTEDAGTLAQVSTLRHTHTFTYAHRNGHSGTRVTHTHTQTKVQTHRHSRMLKQRHSGVLSWWRGQGQNTDPFLFSSSPFPLPGLRALSRLPCEAEVRAGRMAGTAEGRQRAVLIGGRSVQGVGL